MIYIILCSSDNIILCNYDYIVDGVGKSGLFADGRPHQLLYRRNRSEMILTVSIVRLTMSRSQQEYCNW